MKLPFWLKGLLLGVVLDLAVVFVSKFFIYGFIISPFGIFGFFAWFGLFWFIFSLSVLPFICLVIGLIYGAIKSRKQTNLVS